MTGSLQIKSGKFYMVLNSTENGKRKQRWISTGLPVKGNKRKAEQMLRERLAKEGWTASSGEAADIKLSDYIRHWLALSEQRVDEVTMQSSGTEFLTTDTRPKNPANARNLNACVIGSSGSGKTRFWLTPQLLQAHSSYVVVDPNR